MGGVSLATPLDWEQKLQLWEQCCSWIYRTPLPLQNWTENTIYHQQDKSFCQLCCREWGRGRERKRTGGKRREKEEERNEAGRERGKKVWKGRKKEKEERETHRPMQDWNPNEFPVKRSFCRWYQFSFVFLIDGIEADLNWPYVEVGINAPRYLSKRRI